MGISIGEVEATLKLKDSMSPAFAEASANMNRAVGQMQIQLSGAKQSVKDLTDAIKTYGVEAAKKAGLDEQLGAAKVQAVQLQAQMTAVNKALTENASAAKASGDATHGAADEQKRAADAAAAHKKELLDLSETWRAAGTTMRSVGTIMTAAITVPIVAAGTAATHFAAEFQTNMTRVQTLAGATADEVGAMRKEVLELAPATGIGPAELARGLFVVESAMYHGSEATDILTKSAKMSALGMGDTETVARSLIGVMQSYKQQNLSAADASDVLVKTVQLGNMRIDELIPALARVNPLAAAMGISFQDVSAAIATFTHMGAGAQVAATGMRAILSNILNDSTKTEKGFRALAEAVGDSSITMANFRQEIADRGMTVALINLMEQAQKAGEKGMDALNSIFPNVRALTEVLAIAKANGDQYLAISEQILNSTGVMEEGFKTTQQTFDMQWSQMIAQAQTLAIAVGDELLPRLLEFVNYVKSDLLPLIREWIQWFKDLPDPVKRTAFEFAGFMALVGPAIGTLGLLAGAVGNLINLYEKLGFAIGGARAAGAGGAGAAGGAGGALAGGLAVGALSWIGAPAMLQGMDNSASTRQQMLAFAQGGLPQVTGYPDLRSMLPGLVPAQGPGGAAGVDLPGSYKMPGSFGSGAGAPDPNDAEAKKKAEAAAKAWAIEWKKALQDVRDNWQVIFAELNKFVLPRQLFSASNGMATTGPGVIGTMGGADVGFEHSGIPTLQQYMGMNGRVPTAAEMAKFQTFNGFQTFANGNTGSPTLGPVDIRAAARENIAAATTNPYSDILESAPATIASAMTGGGGIAGAASAIGGQFGAQMMKSIFGGPNKGGLLNGMVGTMGETLSNALPIVGALAGPAIEMLIKAFGDHAGKDLKKMGSEWGVTLSQGLVDQLKTDAKKWGGEMQAMLMNLDKIVSEGGGVAAFGVEKAISKTHDLFSMIDSGKLTAAQVGGEFDKMFGEILPVAVDKFTGLASQSFLDLIDTAHRFGVESKSMTDFLAGQGATVAGGFNKIVNASFKPLLDLFDKANAADTALTGGVAGLGDGMDKSAAYTAGLASEIAKTSAKIYDLEHASNALSASQKQQLSDLKVKLTTLQFEFSKLGDTQQKAGKDLEAALKGAQGEFDKMGRLATVAFVAAVSGGQSFVQAIASVSPAFDQLASAQDKFGLKSSGTFDELMNFSKFAKVNKDLLDGLDGVNQMMSGLHNLGLLDQHTFDDLEETASQTFDKMVKGGVSGKIALAAMQPTLQTIWRLHKDFGYTIDANTQLLVDQAVESKIVGEGARTDGEKMSKAMEHVATTLDAIAIALGAHIPDAAKDAQKAIDGLHGKDIHLGVVVDGGFETSSPFFTNGKYNPPPAGAATGGVVMPWGIQHFGRGGLVRGTDTVPAMLTPGEIILNAAQQATVGGQLSSADAIRKQLAADNKETRVQLKKVGDRLAMLPQDLAIQMTVALAARR